MSNRIKIGGAIRLLSALNWHNRQFGDAISQWSHADHNVGAVAQAARQDRRIDAEKSIRRAERESASKLEAVTEILDDDSWSAENRRRLQRCLDAGIDFRGRERCLHTPGHMLNTLRELGMLAPYYSTTRKANHEQTIAQRVDSLIEQANRWGIDATGLAPAVTA